MDSLLSCSLMLLIQFVLGLLPFGILAGFSASCYASLAGASSGYGHYHGQHLLRISDNISRVPNTKPCEKVVSTTKVSFLFFHAMLMILCSKPSLF